MKNKIAIIGAGNIGKAIANGLEQSQLFNAKDITLTRRKIHHLEEFKKRKFNVTNINQEAVQNCDILIIAVEPQQINALLEEIKNELNPAKHKIISIVSGVSIKQIQTQIEKDIPVIRAMPNTAIAIKESMTCLAVHKKDQSSLEIAKSIFDTVGKTLVIDEEQMIAATALGACGVAFFLRAIRAASQGGIEIGFNSDAALAIAAQTAKGAAALLLSKQNHPEYEVDKVTTPRGCTISGLNQMEHAGFSSAMIRGITTSAEKAEKLYNGD